MTKVQAELLKYILGRKKGQGCNPVRGIFSPDIMCKYHCPVQEICEKTAFGIWKQIRDLARRLLRTEKIEEVDEIGKNWTPQERIVEIGQIVECEGDKYKKVTKEHEGCDGCPLHTGKTCYWRIYGPYLPCRFKEKAQFIKLTKEILPKEGEY